MKMNKASFLLAAVVLPWLASAGNPPRFNYPRIFGVRPGSPVVFRLPVSGTRPMTFAAEGLPDGVVLDAGTGVLSGSTSAKGTNVVEFTVVNADGCCVQKFRLIVGDTFVLTPPLGFNTFGGLGAGDRLTDGNVRKSVDALISTGLADHGYSYCNVDDGWQGERGGPKHALQPNERFPDMKGLGDYIHRRGLKFGLYSTPYQRSYARYHGGSSFYRDRSSPLFALRYMTICPYLHDAADAEQIAEWGCDYFKYDWRMSDKELGVDTTHRWKSVEVAERMSRCLLSAKRDITFELSCFVDEDIPERFSAAGSMTRRTGDLMDVWYTKQCPSGSQNMGLRELWLKQRDPWWRVLNRPGHWNMPCPLRVGMLGGWRGPNHPMKPSRLTRAEQYSHISLWCLWASPMIIGAPVDKLDEFTLSLLTNDEMLAVNQDPLGIQAEEFMVKGGEMLVKLLEDGDLAVGLFNVSDGPDDGEVTFDWRKAGLEGASAVVRDLWEHRDIGIRDGSFTVRIPPHGCRVFRVKKTRRYPSVESSP